LLDLLIGHRILPLGKNKNNWDRVSGMSNYLNKIFVVVASITCVGEALSQQGEIGEKCNNN
jgi:hypothetical protein